MTRQFRVFASGTPVFILAAANVAEAAAALDANPILVQGGEVPIGPPGRVATVLVSMREATGDYRDGGRPRDVMAGAVRASFDINAVEQTPIPGADDPPGLDLERAMSGEVSTSFGEAARSTFQPADEAPR